MEWNFLKKKANFRQGIEVGTDSIKLVVLSKRPDSRYTLEGLAIEPLPKKSINTNGEIKNAISVGEAIAKASKKVGIKVNEAATAILATSAVEKTISISKASSDKDIDILVQKEVEHNFPKIASSLSIDYTKLPSKPEDQKQKILLSACRQSILDGFIESHSIAGVNLKIIDIDYYAQARTLNFITNNNKNNGSNPVGILNLSSCLISLVIIKNGTIIYHRDQAFDGELILESCAEIFDSDDWFKSLIEIDKDTIKKNKPKLHQLIDTYIIPPVRQFFQFFETGGNIDPSKIFLSGDYATIPGVARKVSNSIQVPVETINPFKEMTLNNKVSAEQLSLLSPAFATCCGLALHRMFDD